MGHNSLLAFLLIRKRDESSLVQCSLRAFSYKYYIMILSQMKTIHITCQLLVILPTKHISYVCRKIIWN